MKKITALFVLGIAALTMVACSNDEVTEEQPKDEDNKNHTLEEIIDDPVVELSESEFLLSGSVDSNNRNSIVQSISVPQGTDVIEIENGGVVVTVHEGSFSNLKVAFQDVSSDISFETAIMSDKRALENAELENNIEVIEIDLKGYPILGDFQVYFYGDKSDVYYHRLFTEDEEGKRLRVSIEIPKNINLEEGKRLTQLSIVCNINSETFNF
ncbi:hypothetical protein BALCAV_0221145 [Alkalihalobacillus alcalophilus ATCC 27647 = CGMCC 1.3604]|uniref:Lipoprotein n=1 Tax=Alkalihalobacillus alcalophilus ATCC 27647 = CGMCC 1.3604 TaxID=1218173 RepID=A0A094YQ85_ALKAL|nr:hypothetical protein [Alkalihalobacillus alcalophilus]KGA95637.1 hypothetical protein BALCAV_0221145 [Alkalihalobacillus alcalophilus ATCC 27647 = CGMCC 1.3604]MED1563990.1 hypothetical protein [Alkalihalobacillus alcalophilus]